LACPILRILLLILQYRITIGIISSSMVSVVEVVIHS